MSEQENKETIVTPASEENGQSLYADSTAASLETVVTGDKSIEVDSSKEGLADRKNPDDKDLGPIPTMDDFEALKYGGEPFSGKKKEVEKGEALKTDIKVVPDAKALETAKEEVKKDESVKSANALPGKVERDYAGLEEQEAKLLKNTSNEAFAWLKPQLLEKKQLATIIKKKDEELAALKSGKQILPDSYYEHPQAFVLDSTYNTLSRDLNMASGIENHWKGQLAKIRRGEEWQGLQINDRGQFVLTQPQKGTPEAEADVLAYINHAAAQTADVQRKVIGFQNEFGSRHKQAVNVLKATEKEQFSAYEDANHPMQPVIKNIMQMIPAEFRSNPLAPLTAKAAAAAIQLKNLYTAKEVEFVKLKEEFEAYKKGTPTGKQRTPSDADITSAGSRGSKNGNQKEPTMADFNALRN